jgi:hypothetical protein
MEHIEPNLATYLNENLDPIFNEELRLIDFLPA